MKCIHLSDLHLGKRLNGFSMIEDQRHILQQILQIVEEERPDAVLIAGDVYDRPIPSVEAMGLFDDLLKRLVRAQVQVFIISGNHDSPERLAFAAELIAYSGIHIAPVYDGTVRPVSVEDAYGPVNIYMLPFIRPAHVRGIFPEEEIGSYTDAVRTAVAHMEVRETQRNILLTHQFVTGAARTESEEIVVGGADNVDASVFGPFDYVALGHIHGPQHVGRESIRYCGTPLKYSFSEMRHRKSVTVLELGKKGTLGIRTRELTPLHEMREIKGTYAELTAKENYEGTAVEDHLRVILTDEEDVLDAASKLRVIYPHLMELRYDNRRTREGQEIAGGEAVKEKTPLELVRDFYRLQNDRDMNEEQEAFVERAIERIWEEDI